MPASLMYFCSGEPKHFCSGVDSAMFAACLLVAAHAANAAAISVSSLGNSETAIVTFEGDIVSSDAEQFQQKTSSISKAIVVMSSDGGSLLAGIQVGRIIRLRNYVTLVPDGARCASACALAWLGGTARYMAAKAQVGFHAAYNAASGQETGVGNALVGAYLSQIGLPDRAVVYVTQASPQSMTWLTMSEARERGIDVTLFTSPRDQPNKETESPTVADNTQAMRRRSSEFILALVKKSNLVDSSSVSPWLSPLYDSDVNYFGARKAKQSVLDEKRKFFERWPQRDYQVREGSMNIQCDQAASTCWVTGIVDWSAANPTRAAKASGVASFKYGLRLTSTVVITEETSAVLRREQATKSGVANLPVTPSSAPPIGAYSVVVVSQKNEADALAAYQVMQSRFPNVLGGRQPIIRRADLGDNRIFYRGTVGPFSTAELAVDFCNRLKTAGGQCVVQRD